MVKSATDHSSKQADSTAGEVTAIGMVREIFPDISDADADEVLWARTGWPGFFHGDPKTCLREQLIQYRDALRLNVPLCEFCNSPAVKGKWLCASCDNALTALTPEPTQDRGDEK